jgi:hypothetical protein
VCAAGFMSLLIGGVFFLFHPGLGVAIFFISFCIFFLAFSASQGEGATTKSQECTLQWDEFWQKRLEASYRESTQGSLDNYEIGSVEGGEAECADALVWLDQHHPEYRYGAFELGNSWMILGRTAGNRPIGAQKRERIQCEFEERS